MGRSNSIQVAEFEPGPSSFALAVDERVLVEERLADLDAAVFGRQVERAPALQVEDVHSAVVVQKYLVHKDSKACNVGRP